MNPLFILFAYFAFMCQLVAQTNEIFWVVDRNPFIQISVAVDRLPSPDCSVVVMWGQGAGFLEPEWSMGEAMLQPSGTNSISAAFTAATNLSVSVAAKIVATNDLVVFHDVVWQRIPHIDGVPAVEFDSAAYNVQKLNDLLLSVDRKRHAKPPM